MSLFAHSNVLINCFSFSMAVVSNRMTNCLLGGVGEAYFARINVFLDDSQFRI